MPYATIQWSTFRAQLAARLGDVSNIFWTDTENGIWLAEALRLFGLCSGFWRERGILTTVAGTAFYDLNALLLNGAFLPLSPTVTDRNIIQQLQFALLESTTSQTSWPGTEMFTYADITNAVQNRLNQFLADTGIVVNASTVNVVAPPVGRQLLDQKTIDVRRAAWVGASPLNYYVPLWRDDERLLTAADQTWSVNPGTPEAFSIMAPPPLQLQLSPIPISNGQLELLTVDSTTLNPSVTATILGIPDDLTPAIKWGALADLLGKDGIARDPARAQYAEQMYQLYVRLARVLPVVIHTEISGIPMIACTLQELESSTPNWENTSGTPTDIALCSSNLVALSPVPDNIYSMTFDVVRRAVIPITDGNYIQVGREQLDMILDFAEHLALFKVGGLEWKATSRQAANFLAQSLTYNQRLSAAARAVISASEQSQRQKRATPRRLDNGMGIGALKGTPSGGSQV
jgi:hypothetical protein